MCFLVSSMHMNQCFLSRITLIIVCSLDGKLKGRATLSRLLSSATTANVVSVAKCTFVRTEGATESLLHRVGCAQCCAFAAVYNFGLPTLERNVRVSREKTPCDPGDEKVSKCPLKGKLV